MASAPGGAVSCSCGAVMEAPAASESDCVLVYKDGFPNEGLPITLDELGRQVAAGGFVPLDLIHYNGIWQPLNMVFNMPEQPEIKVDTRDEIALKWKELRPAPGFASSGSVNMGGIKGVLNDLWHWFLRMRKFRYKTPMQKIAYVLAFLVLAFLLYTFLVGKLLNRILWRPAYVAVYNSGDSELKARLMGRKLNIAPGNVGVFQDLFVSFPGSHTLKLNGADGKKSIRVPVRPDFDVLVNPGGSGAIGEYDLAECGKMSLDTAVVKKLSRQIASLSGPDALNEVLRELHDMGDKVYQGRIDDVLLSDASYDLSHIGIARSIEYSQREKRKTDRGDDRPIVMLDEKVKLSFANASTEFRSGRIEVPGTFSVVFDADFSPLDKAAAAKAASDRVRVIPMKKAAVQANVRILEDGSVNLVLGGLKGNVFAFIKQIGREMEFTGNWIYTATLCKKGSNAGKWTWKWQYSGRALVHAKDKAPRPFSMTVQRDYKGNTSVSY